MNECNAIYLNGNTFEELQVLDSIPTSKTHSSSSDAH